MREHVARITIKDCRVETYRGSGKGGQNRNKRDTAVRITHPPSGAIGRAEDERHQWQNKKLAFRRMAETGEFKRWIATLLGVEDPPDSRSEAYVRTYNLIDKRVKDHRTGKQTSNVDAVLDGDLDRLG